MSMLPANYNVPSKSDQFLSLKEGSTKLRILNQKLVEGYVIFDSKKTPHRKKMDRFGGQKASEFEFTKEELDRLDLRANEKGVKESPRPFAIFLVYEYASDEFKSWEVTQKGILLSLAEYFSQEDWSDPSKYNFVIKKTGSGLSTEYSLNPELPKPLPDGVLERFENLHYNLDAVFSNGYPFDK